MWTSPQLAIRSARALTPSSAASHASARVNSQGADSPSVFCFRYHIQDTMGHIQHLISFLSYQVTCEWSAPVRHALNLGISLDAVPSLPTPRGFSQYLRFQERCHMNHLEQSPKMLSITVPLRCVKDPPCLWVPHGAGDLLSAFLPFPSRSVVPPPHVGLQSPPPPAALRDGS